MIKIALCLVLILLCDVLIGQQNPECTLNIKGFIIDEHDQERLAYANITIEETGQGINSDSSGLFSIDHVCPGQYHIIVSHIGCETVRVFLTIGGDTSLNFVLEHHAEFIEELTVIGISEEDRLLQNKSKINESEIRSMSSETFADIASNITGVTMLKNGGSIAKPVIHGLYGNRVIVLNNGIIQAGQQWGNGHAPEIDPNVASNISVIKGASSVLYGANAIGGMVVMTPGSIPKDPHIHGSVRSAYRSNGRGLNGSVRLEQSAQWLDWRMIASAKHFGDRSAPNYHLTNTANREASFALQLHKSWGEQLSTDIYYSYYYTQLGILRASHIGNLTDLKTSIESSVPAYTSSDFSYDVHEPKQLIKHHLIKATTSYYITEANSLKFTFAYQNNDRAEFDVRRADRSAIPALQLNNETIFYDLVFLNSPNETNTNKIGVQSSYRLNLNNPDTGILPLIPNYKGLTLSPYVLIQKSFGDWNSEAGFRIDFRNTEVANITNTSPRSIENIVLGQINYVGSIGIEKELSQGWTSYLSVNYVQRSPEINELFSAGLHQGVAGIEEGDQNLIAERSTKILFSNFLQLNNKTRLEMSPYLQFIRDFIYLNPSDDFRLTIRGAFPVFQYEQDHARIAGLDLTFRTNISEYINLSAKYALVRGLNTEKSIPLVYMPSDQINMELAVSFKDSGTLHNTQLKLTGTYIAEQTRLEDFQDFLAPPKHYFLTDIGISTNVILGKKNINLSLGIDNLFNVAYRNYLNRLRYFADEEGRNIRVVMSYEF